ncbi:MAG: VPLPA-CTERM-specific exosortase XrtD [Gammaproteobacteria bacterium]|nr:VPLPA-CTERM-specific exosortase XrtD [Gammaproteobacteria bacterium]MBQ0840672.1 VPLPA-CTERM-specific exosortase XrtD [Gammaproteobacteria bacterium]
MNIREVQPVCEYRYPAYFWVALLIVAGVLIIPFYAALDHMVGKWLGTDEYSHAIFLPFVAAFFLWCNKDDLALRVLQGSWLGPLVVILGFALQIAGELASLYTVTQYAYLLVIVGFVLSISGVRDFFKFVPALIILFFTIPLPNFIYNNLSAKLQLISSELGVLFIRIFGIPVYLQGNVIDLGAMKLQVVEACSGLNYLFPLLSIGFIAAYIFKAPWWQRLAVFLSVIPITVIMNSVRIGVIGVSVNRFGSALTEGVLHFFEGWVVFMISLAILFLEIWLFNRVFDRKTAFADAFSLTLPAPRNKAPKSLRAIPKSFVISVLIALVFSLASLLLPAREDVIPQRLHFSTYPMFLGTWTGQRRVMDSVYIDALKFDDYILVDYNDGKGSNVNFYTAYYASQRKGQSAHSPRSCIPGGGWQINELSIVELPINGQDGKPLKANRVLITKGDYSQLVYYWFQQQGRHITSEYAVKWHLFLDALISNRTDGALVRFTTLVSKEDDLATKDELLQSFMGLHYSILQPYVPD